MINPKSPVNYNSGWLTSEGVTVLSEAEASACDTIEQMFNRFCQMFDADDAKGFSALFTPDATAEFDSDTAAGVIRGREAIAAWHHRHRQAQKKDGHFYRHQVLVPVINVSGDNAELLAYLTADALQYSDQHIHVDMGRYEAKLRRTPEGWQIAALQELLFFGFHCNEQVYHESGREALNRIKETK